MTEGASVKALDNVVNQSKNESDIAFSSLFKHYQTNASNYKKIVFSVVEQLDSLQSLTEQVFMNVGEKLPGINQSLHGAESTAGTLLDYFKKESGLLGNDTDRRSSDLSKLNHASKYLISIIGDQGEAFFKMREMMKRIVNVKASIESIRDFSIEMEMLSLNAAIVATKAGDEGRSLNPITVELKKMANASVFLIDEIVQTSEALEEKYSLFQDISEQQAESCRVDVEKINSNLSSSYKDLQSSIVVLVDRLNKISGAVKESGQSISSIMNTLQIQDIVKQCTDHVRLALIEANSAASVFMQVNDMDSNRSDQLLDALEFQQEVPRLCIELINDINIRLESSISGLESDFKTINSLLLGADADISDFTGEAKDDEMAIAEVERSFTGLRGVIAEIAVMIQEAATSWDHLWSTAVNLTSMMETLENQFRQLKKTTNFHLINIPIKIEVAKSFALAEDGGLSARVDGLAEYISTEMRQSHKEVRQDHELLSQMVASMSKSKQDIDQNLGLLALDIDDLLGNFRRANEQVKTAFIGVIAHISELLELVQASLSDLDRVYYLVEQNRKLEDEFNKMALMAQETKELTLSVIDNVDWQLRDSRLKNIINKFTVLSHKKIAESLYSIDVEDGNHEGELILF